MNRSRRSLIAASVLALAALAAAFARPQEPERAPRVADLGWLAGTWSGDMWGGRFVAYYSTAEGGKVLSHSKLLEDGKVAFYEFEVFEERDGAVALQPYPGGKPADGFRLASLDGAARKATFENPEKDFPTRIVYERVADDRLTIVLSDPHGGSDKVERFELAR